MSVKPIDGIARRAQSEKRSAEAFHRLQERLGILPTKAIDPCLGIDTTRQVVIPLRARNPPHVFVKRAFSQVRFD